MTASGAPRKNKLSRRKKAKARQTLNKAFLTVVSEIESDTFLKNHLVSEKKAKNKIAVGAYIIAKNKDGMFDIYKQNMKHLVHKDIMIFDAAMAIVESLNMKKEASVKQIIEVEEEYARNYMEMLHFKNAFTHALKASDGNAAVFEDRYVIAKFRAKSAREKLRGFRTAGKTQ
jgi:hypothetical protein